MPRTFIRVITPGIARPRHVDPDLLSEVIVDENLGFSLLSRDC